MRKQPAKERKANKNAVLYDKSKLSSPFHRRWVKGDGGLVEVGEVKDEPRTRPHTLGALVP